MTTQVTKVTISLPQNLISFADEVASRGNISRSKVISNCLSELARNRKEELMIEYYTTMAKEHKDFAKQSTKVIQNIASCWGD